MIRRVSDALSVVRFKHRKTPNLHFYTDSSVTVVTVSGSVAYSVSKTFAIPSLRLDELC